MSNTLKIPPPKKPGPKATCDCGVCLTCLNRIRVLRNYYVKKLGKDSPKFKEMLEDGQLY